MCRFFKCSSNPEGCHYCYNGACPASGYDGHKMCGCDACVFQRYNGDEVVCTNEKATENNNSFDVLETSKEA